ncbi:hypothetical protein GGI17_001254 [Coemansia sp. S146]|nr:hypothetical protein GGI17_001254 [Coemansia sp. S146]
MRYVISIACLAVLAAAQHSQGPGGEPLHQNPLDQAFPHQYTHDIKRVPVQARVPTRGPLGNPPPRLSPPILRYPSAPPGAPPYLPQAAKPLSRPEVAHGDSGSPPNIVAQRPSKPKSMSGADGIISNTDFGSALEFGPPSTPHPPQPAFKRPFEQWPIALSDPQPSEKDTTAALGDNWPVFSEIFDTISAVSGAQSDLSSNSLVPTTAETKVAAASSVAPTAHTTSATKSPPRSISVSSSPAPAPATAAMVRASSAVLCYNASCSAVGANANNDTQRAGGVIRVPASKYATDLLTMPTQDVLGDVRQEPGSGMGMGYHGHSMVRGVNIGGFLVPEFWITPSLIAAIPEPKPNDYLQLCNRLGPEATLNLMRRHWESWVTEAEIQRLAAAGITHLRIPIGHWEFVDSDEGFVRGGLPYFKRLVYWANRHGLKVIPDMHTAPGSQNGFDNSGSTTGVNWTKDQRNVSLSKRALQTMLKYIANDPVLLATTDAVDMLNEPFIDSLDFGQLWEYDTGGHILISNGLGKTPPVVSIVDRGFKEFSWWQSRWPRDWNSKYADAWLDAHLYHVFDRNIDDWPLESHLRLVCQNGRDLKANSTSFPIIVGEWSLALPQAALRGRENEARRRFAEAQLDAYELGGAGWIFWCFKTEASPEWSFLDALDRSWMPQPLTNREFSPICKY